VAWPGQVRRLAVLTGAGVSAESGVPTFRGHGGLWRSYRSEELATPQAFRRDPELVWQWYNWRRELIGACQPNAAHVTLAEMEESSADEADQEGRSFVLITQNVDGLHRIAGSHNVLELHGNIWRQRCTRGCRPPWIDRRVLLPEIPPLCPDCGALARPDVVWFGESLPGPVLEEAWAAARRCHLMLVVGTSALVQPAASLPLLALEVGAHVVEINPQSTPLSDAVDEVIRQSAAVALPEWWSAWQMTGKSRGAFAANSATQMN
jgi:NAD-dependent deacetylase